MMAYIYDLSEDDIDKFVYKIKGLKGRAFNKMNDFLDRVPIYYEDKLHKYREESKKLGEKLENEYDPIIITLYPKLNDFYYLKDGITNFLKNKWNLAEFKNAQDLYHHWLLHIYHGIMTKDYLEQLNEWYRKEFESPNLDSSKISFSKYNLLNEKDNLEFLKVFKDNSEFANLFLNLLLGAGLIDKRCVWLPGSKNKVYAIRGLYEAFRKCHLINMSFSERHIISTIREYISAGEGFINCVKVDSKGEKFYNQALIEIKKNIPKE